MSRFLLIDHSLKGVGGHHFEYALHVLRAAERAGHEVELAVHRKFRGDGAFPDRWPVARTFTRVTYSDYALYQSSRSTPAHGDPSSDDQALSRRESRSFSLKRWWSDVRCRWGRRRQVNAFRHGLAQLFRKRPIAPGDVVFIPTLSELDLLGLAEYAATDPRTRDAAWHLQFHYNIFDGREPQHAAQRHRLDAMREMFAAAWKHLSGHVIRCYTTTDQLTAQYNQLGIAAFATMPYPVNPAFHEPREPIARRDAGPLRVTCAGSIRAEKGTQELGQIIQQVWSELLAPGRMQLVVQSNKSWFRLPLPGPIDESRSAPVIYAPHPLSTEQYVELIRQADVGLLLYDADRYYARCSGILVEMLCLGIPVIVTAGCWMADQLADEYRRHVSRAEHELQTVGLSRWRGLVGEAMTPDPNATHAIVTLHWPTSPPAGVYLRVEAHAVDADTHPDRQAAWTTIIGGPVGATTTRVLVPVAAGMAGLEFRIQSAYDDVKLSTPDVECRWLSAEKQPGGKYPLSAVGLVAPDVANVAPLLWDLAAHIDHYAATARRFSREWNERYCAAEIVRRVTASAVLKPSRAA